MIRKLIAAAALSLSTGCSVAVVYAPKSVDIRHSKGIKAESSLTGSDLKDFKADQSAEGSIPASVLP